MKDKAIVENEIIAALRELRWRINKLEEMKNGLPVMNHSQTAEENYATRSLSSQFFLTLSK